MKSSQHISLGGRLVSCMNIVCINSDKKQGTPMNMVTMQYHSQIKVLALILQSLNLSLLVLLGRGSCGDVDLKLESWGLPGRDFGRRSPLTSTDHQLQGRLLLGILPRRDRDEPRRLPRGRLLPPFLAHLSKYHLPPCNVGNQDHDHILSSVGKI